MAVRPQTKPNKKSAIQNLGLKSPMEVIDILSLCRVEGEPVIKDDKDWLDPNRKAKAVVSFFTSKFDIDPKDLPYLASLIKHDIKNGRLSKERT
jgi:hypothetical protein